MNGVPGEYRLGYVCDVHESMHVQEIPPGFRNKRLAESTAPL